MNHTLRLIALFALTAIGCAHKVNPQSVSVQPPPTSASPKTTPPMHSALSVVTRPVTKIEPRYDNVDLEFLPNEAKARLRVKASSGASLSLSRMTMIADGSAQELPETQSTTPYCVVYNRDAGSNVKDGEILKLTPPSVFRDVGTLQIYLTKGVYLQCLNFVGVVTLAKINQVLGGVALVYLESPRN